MSNPNKVVIAAANKPKVSPFLSNMIVSGHLVYMSGVVGLDDKGDWVEGTIKDRTTAALKIVSTRLSHIGLDLSDVISIQIFLANYKEDFAAMNEAYTEAFPKNAPMPVRTCIGVANLPAGTDIEMTVITAKRS